MRSGASNAATCVDTGGVVAPRSARPRHRPAAARARRRASAASRSALVTSTTGRAPASHASTLSRSTRSMLGRSAGHVTSTRSTFGRQHLQPVAVRIHAGERRPALGHGRDDRGGSAGSTPPSRRPPAASSATATSSPVGRRHPARDPLDAHHPAGHAGRRACSASSTVPHGRSSRTARGRASGRSRHHVPADQRTIENGSPDASTSARRRREVRIEAQLDARPRRGRRRDRPSGAPRRSDRDRGDPLPLRVGPRRERPGVERVLEQARRRGSAPRPAAAAKWRRRHAVIATSPQHRAAARRRGPTPPPGRQSRGNQ